MRKLLLLLPLLLAACGYLPKVGPTYTAPILSLPSGWFSSSVSSSAPVGNLAWWQAFNDPTLNTLIEQALTNNADLKIAAARVQSARGARLAAQAENLPNIGAHASGKRGNANATNSTQNSFEAAFDASWEVDLFGGTARAAESARARLAASKAAQQQAKITLLAEVARTYLSVRQLQQQVSLTTATVQAQNETLRIVQAQFNEGVASQLDLDRATAQAATTAATLPSVQTTLVATQNALAILTGNQPATLQALISTTAPVPTASATVLVNTPATVIANRPDVQLAERTLAAATANQGVAMSQWFPRLNLAGLFGLQHTPALDTVDIFSTGATLNLSLFDFGRVRALVRQADAGQAEALAMYEKTVLSALADVENSLTAYINESKRSGHLTTAATSATNAARLAGLKYKEGAISLLDFLTAQQQAYSAQSAAAQGQAALGQAYASLYKALAGATSIPPLPAR